MTLKANLITHAFQFGPLSRVSHQITSPWRIARVRASVYLAPQPPPHHPANAQHQLTKKFTLNSPLYFPMSSLNVPGPSPYASFFRHRTLGRAPSPPTWACYEQIQYDGEYSDDSASDGDSHDDDDDEDDDDEDHDRDDSCSEDDEDYGRLPESPSSIQSHEPPSSTEDSEKTKDSSDEAKKDVKGKGRAVDPEHEVGDSVQPPPSKPRIRTKKRHSGRRTRTLRPILTIHKSQGFVWNQVGNGILCTGHPRIFRRSHLPSTGPLRASLYQRPL